MKVPIFLMASMRILAAAGCAVRGDESSGPPADTTASPSQPTVGAPQSGTVAQSRSTAGGTAGAVTSGTTGGDTGAGATTGSILENRESGSAGSVKRLPQGYAALFNKVGARVSFGLSDDRTHWRNDSLEMDADEPTKANWLEINNSGHKKDYQLVAESRYDLLEDSNSHDIVLKRVSND